VYVLHYCMLCCQSWRIKIFTTPIYLLTLRKVAIEPTASTVVYSTLSVTCVVVRGRATRSTRRSVQCYSARDLNHIITHRPSSRPLSGKTHRRHRVVHGSILFDPIQPNPWTTLLHHHHRHYVRCPTGQHSCTHRPYDARVLCSSPFHLRPALLTVDHTSSTTCRHLPAFTSVPNYTAW